MKEQLVTQLKTQVSDLERYIEFLQGPAEKQCCPHAGGSHPNKPTPKFNPKSNEQGQFSSAKPLQLNEKNVNIFFFSDTTTIL